jgi:hypothetical protein
MKNKKLLFASFSLLHKDFSTFLEYVEPTDTNLKCYSQRSFELLLRAATEFESICKDILIDKSYADTRPQDYWNIADYQEVLKYYALEPMAVTLSNWRPNPIDFRPFQNWSVSKLAWYADYNAVKHNRQTALNKASLENLVLAICSIVAIYFRLHGPLFFIPYGGIQGHHSTTGPFEKNIYIPDTFYIIKEPL